MPYKSFGSLPPIIPPSISGWPDATNTGIPAGTTLTPFSGSFTTTSNGQIVDSLDVSGDIFVHHSDVIVRKCRARSMYIGADDQPFTTTNGLIEDCEITGGTN